MDFRQLKYFVAVAEDLSFSAAARRLHISQPPLSTQIKALEEELGAVLLDRGTRQVALTTAGAVFLLEARRTLAQLERAGESVRQAAQGEMGELRIAFTASVPMVDAFPRIVQEFRRRYPRARADLMHMSTGQQLVALSEQQIDVGFLRPSILFSPPPGIETIEWGADELVAVLPIGHHLAVQNTPLAVSDLRAEPFILFPRGLGCGLYEHVSVLASRAGFALRIGQEAREGATIIGLIATGMGVSILPKTYSKTGIPGVVYRDLASDDAQSRLLMAYRGNDAAPLLHRFVAAARSLIAQA
jgi:DNA-binding transcriptional LysR family regulator